VIKIIGLTEQITDLHSESLSMSPPAPRPIQGHTAHNTDFNSSSTTLSEPWTLLIDLRHALICSSTVSYFGELITSFKQTFSKQDSIHSTQQGCTKNNATPSNDL
jgi:hypothetical protein